MAMYNGGGADDPAKAMTVMFANADGRIGRWSDAKLKRVFASGGANSCVANAFEDSVCYTLHFSDYFNPTSLSRLISLKNMKSFFDFIIGVSSANPAKVASATRRLMVNVVRPVMNTAIGGITFLTRTDPVSKFNLELIMCGVD